MLGQTKVGARRGSGWEDANGVQVEGRFSPTAEQQRKLGIGSCWFWADGGQYYFEMTPNPESRVRLTDPGDCDPIFHRRKVHITWELSPRDEETYKETTQLFKTAVTARKGGVSFPPWETVKNQLVVNGHHIGTTRMSAEPEDGVVDANLKVHSLANLYVAGASVFASAGISNPTFTIIALSIRLAKHLTGVLGAATA